MEGRRRLGGLLRARLREGSCLCVDGVCACMHGAWWWHLSLCVVSMSWAQRDLSCKLLVRETGRGSESGRYLGEGRVEDSGESGSVWGSQQELDAG